MNRHVPRPHRFRPVPGLRDVEAYVRQALPHGMMSMLLALAGLFAFPAIGQSTPAADPPPPRFPEPPTFTQTMIAEPFRVGTIEATLPDGPVRGLYAVVDLTDPRLDVVVTAPLPPEPPESPASPDAPDTAGPRQAPNLAEVDALAIPTDQWARDNDVTLAINANFFGRSSDNRDQLDVIGLSLSSGRVVSPPRVHAGRPDPAILFFDGHGDSREVRLVRELRRLVQQNPQFPSQTDQPVPGQVPRWVIHDHALIAPPTEGHLAWATEAVAGVGPSDRVPDRDRWLVTDGENTGEHSRVAPERRHPRTAVGVNAAGDTAILLVVDGRQEGWSIGVTLPELADLMIRLGADDALNLDGGGSSAFVFTNPRTGEVITNRPSDLRDGERIFRGVANHLGFRLREPRP